MPRCNHQGCNINVITPFVVLIVLSQLVGTCHSFSPTAAPRFDVFLENIVKPMRDSNNNGGGGDIMAVEEVMRSCGGAVQGVTDAGYYLNRADDGFVYFNCGSYVHTPTKVGASLSQDWRCSFAAAFDSSNRNDDDDARLVLIAKKDPTMSSDDNDDIKDVLLSMLLPSKLEKAILVTKSKTVDQRVVHQKDSSFRVTNQLSCRMSSPSQPWNLQRAKWEKTATQDGNTIDVPPSSSSSTDNGIDDHETTISTYTCWIDSSSNTSSSGDGTFMDVSFGITCHETKSVKEFVQSYDVDGKLVRVTLNTGTTSNFCLES